MGIINTGNSHPFLNNYKFFYKKSVTNIKKPIYLQYETQNFVQKFNVQNILFTDYLRTFIKKYQFWVQ